MDASIPLRHAEVFRTDAGGEWYDSRLPTAKMTGVAANVTEPIPDNARRTSGQELGDHTMRIMTAMRSLHPSGREPTRLIPAVRRHGPGHHAGPGRAAE